MFDKMRTPTHHYWYIKKLKSMLSDLEMRPVFKLGDTWVFKDDKFILRLKEGRISIMDDERGYFSEEARYYVIVNPEDGKIIAAAVVGNHNFDIFDSDRGHLWTAKYTEGFLSELR